MQVLGLQKLLFLYKEIPAVNLGMLEVSFDVIGNLRVVNNRAASHSAVPCAETADIYVVLPLNLLVTAGGEKEEHVAASVEDVVLDNEVRRINESTRANMRCRALVGTGIAEAVACESAEVVLVGDVREIPCRAGICSVEVLDGVDAVEDYVIRVGYVLHNVVALCGM